MTQSRSVGFTFYAKEMFEQTALRVARSLEGVKKGVQGVGTASRGAAYDIAKAESGLASIDSTAAKAAGGAGGIAKLDRLWGTLGRRMAATALSYASVATLKHVLSEAATVEDAVNKVMSLVRDPADAGAYAAKVTAIIRDNQRLGLSVATLGDALAEQVATLGTGKDSFDAFNGAVKLSVAAFQPLESSVAAVNKLVDAFPKLRGHGAAAAQMLFTSRQMTNDYTGLVAGLPNFAPIAATAGVSPERMLALFTVLADETKSAATATAVETDLLRTLGTKGTPKQTALLKQMSIVATPEGLAQAGLATQLARLRLVTQRNPAAASAIGLGDATQKALLTMSDADLKRIGAAEAAIVGDAQRGSIGQSFLRVQSSMSAEMAKTNESLNELSSVIGSDLSPAAREIAGYLRTALAVRDPQRDLGVRPGASMAEILYAIGKQSHRTGASGLDAGGRPGKE